MQSVLQAVRAWRVQRRVLAQARELEPELKLVQVRAQRLAPGPGLEPGLEPGPEPVRVLELESAQVRAQGALPVWRAAVQIVMQQE